ncbi:MAG: hypothetical protein IH614_08095 [Desulfuromonadales bacterium]|nr:hypothetical protein [Desulfuromonadales bacterium]
MKCPVCKSSGRVANHLRSSGPDTNIVECRICGTVWSIQHGSVGVVRDVQARSFLEAQTECVEGDDYNLVGEPG